MTFESNGESGEALRRPLLRRVLDPVSQHARFQIAANQTQHLLVIDPARDPRHQSIVLDTVKGRHDTLPTSTASRSGCGSCARGIRWRAARSR